MIILIGRDRLNPIPAETTFWPFTEILLKDRPSRFSVIPDPSYSIRYFTQSPFSDCSPMLLTIPVS